MTVTGHHGPRPPKGMMIMPGRSRGRAGAAPVEGQQAPDEGSAAPVDTAPREDTTPDATEETTDAPVFQVQPSTGLIATVRTGKPNPLNGVVRPTLTSGPQKIAVADSEQAKNVTSWLRRDAKDNGLALSIQYQDGNGNRVELKDATEVHFVAGTEIRQRRYTKAQIVAWAQENESVNWDGKGKVPEGVRETFKSANGYA